MWFHFWNLFHQDDLLLNDGQTLGNCGFTNQTARPQAPATVGLAFRLTGESFRLVCPSAASISPFCRPPFHRFLSSSQMTRSSSWGSSPSPPPLSFPTSWSPRTRAAQPTSRPSSEGGRKGARAMHAGSRREDAQRGGEEGREGGGNIWRSLSRWLFSCRGQTFTNRCNHGFSSMQIQRVGTQRFPFSWNERMPERSKKFTSHQTLTDSSRRCHSRMGLVKGQTLRIVPRI